MCKRVVGDENTLLQVELLQVVTVARQGLKSIVGELITTGDLKGDQRVATVANWYQGNVSEVGAIWDTEVAQLRAVAGQSLDGIVRDGAAAMQIYCAQVDAIGRQKENCLIVDARANFANEGTEFFAAKWQLLNTILWYLVAVGYVDVLQLRTTSTAKWEHLVMRLWYEC